MALRLLTRKEIHEECRMPLSSVDSRMAELGVSPFAPPKTGRGHSLLYDANEIDVALKNEREKQQARKEKRKPRILRQPQKHEDICHELVAGKGALDASRRQTASIIMAIEKRKYAHRTTYRAYWRNPWTHKIEKGPSRESLKEARKDESEYFLPEGVSPSINGPTLYQLSQLHLARTDLA